jgi:serine/threonine-protein kinase
MSPEQARGQRNVDHRADLWSLAVLAFECLTGRQPFESESIGDLVVKICTSDPLVPSAIASVPLGFDAWFLRGVRKDIEGRYTSALQMADALHDLFAAEGRAASSRPRSSSQGLVHELTQLAPNSPRRDPGSSRRTVPERITGTGAAVATEVVSPAPAPPRRRPGTRAVGAVILALIGLALFFVPGWTRVRTPTDPPSQSAGGGTPSRSDPAPGEVPRPVSPDPPGRIEAPATDVQPHVPEAPKTTEPAADPGSGLGRATTPPGDALPLPVPTSDKRIRRHASKPAQRRPATPVPVTPKATPSDPFSDRL